VSEKLYIKNFYAIEEFDWKIKDFNVLTGGMGSGKSICVKLLWFLENIFYLLIFNSSLKKEDLRSPVFLDRIAKEFKEIFYTGDFDFSATKINYTYSCNGGTFDLKASWSEEKQDLAWSSKYLNERLEQWQKFFGTKETALDIGIMASNQIYRYVLKDFNNTFPIGAMFIPASRAIAAITDNTDFLDQFVVNLIKTSKRIVRSIEISDKKANDILHIENIKYEEKQGVLITLPNGSEISPQYLSSGQQELLYLLLYFSYLKRNAPFQFATGTSIFIEEPEAHLFPQGQKDIMEFFADIFRIYGYTGKRPTRFFITTHSPYILNIVSTMMNRGKLRKKKKKMGKSEGTGFDSNYYFKKGEVSAYSIDDDKIVRSMVSENEDYIFAEKINKISQAIFDEASLIDEQIAELDANHTP
jgi:predicted ATPase